MRYKIIFLILTIPIFIFLLVKPKIGLKMTIFHNNLCMRILRQKNRKLPKLWKYIGIDENNAVLPDGEKRFRIYMAIFAIIWIIIVLLIPS